MPGLFALLCLLCLLHAISSGVLEGGVPACLSLQISRGLAPKVPVPDPLRLRKRLSLFTISLSTTPPKSQQPSPH